MRIALISDTFSPEINGVAKTLERFTYYLSRQRIDYEIFAPESSSRTFSPLPINHSLSIPFFLYPQCRFALPNIIKIKKKIREFNPTIMHVATPFSMGLSGIHVAKKLSIPLVGSHHTDFEHYLPSYKLGHLSPLLWRYMKWFYEPFEEIFVPSLETKKQLLNQGFKDVSIWSRGVDHHLFHPYYDKFDIRIKYNIKRPYILTYVGRLSPEKNVAFLLKLSRLLPNHLRHQVQWLIVGDGPSKEALEQEAGDSITFIGFLEHEHLAKLYAASDLFIFPSETETFGNVVLEALSCGTPVIAANAGGVKHIVSNKKNGYLCTPNSLEEFIESICTLLESPQLRLRFGDAARRYALTQSWDSVFDQLLLRYEAVATKSTHGLEFVQ